MSDDHGAEGDYKAARQVSAVALVTVVVAVVILDSLGIGRPVDPLIVASLLISAAGLLAVDLPGLKH